MLIKNEVEKSKSKYHFKIYRKKNQEKLILIIIIIFLTIYVTKEYDKWLNDNYLDLQKEINLSFSNKIYKKIRIGIIARSLGGGGIARMTSLILKYFSKIKIFKLFLLTFRQVKNEYFLPENIIRITNVPLYNNRLINLIKKCKIDVFIYQFLSINIIRSLNQLEKIKVILFPHISMFSWIYSHSFKPYKQLINEYKHSKYVINLIPLENDYLFEKWGIKSILMNNFLSYDFKSIKPSDLSSQRILMIGRGYAKMKRFGLGIMAMRYICKELPQSQMNILSAKCGMNEEKKLVKLYNLKKNILFLGYISEPSIYFKNASLHIFPSLNEAYPMVLGEMKAYGIPSILVGLDYITLSKGGTVIVYDESPMTIAKESIDILKNETLRKKIGKDARESLKLYDNNVIFKKWI